MGMLMMMTVMIAVYQTAKKDSWCCMRRDTTYNRVMCVRQGLRGMFHWDQSDCYRASCCCSAWKRHVLTTIRQHVAVHSRSATDSRQGFYKRPKALPISRPLLTTCAESSVASLLPSLHVGPETTSVKVYPRQLPLNRTPTPTHPRIGDGGAANP